MVSYQDYSNFENMLKQKVNLCIPLINLRDSVKFEGPLFENIRTYIQYANDTFYFSLKDPIKVGKTYYKLTFQVLESGKIQHMTGHSAFSCSQAKPEVISSLYEKITDFISTLDLKALEKASLIANKKQLDIDIAHNAELVEEYNKALTRAYNECVEALEETFYKLSASTNATIKQNRDSAKRVSNQFKTEIRTFKK